LQGRFSALFAIIALLAGLAIGFAGSTLGYRYGLLQLPGERPFQRMARVLQLNPAQREQIRAVMHETRAKVEAARDNFEQQRHAIFLNTYLRIRALLSPAQQKTFDARFVPPSIRAEARTHDQARTAAAPLSSSASPTPP
jgi:Spy/CpxP family protein refolding chaperone